MLVVKKLESPLVGIPGALRDRQLLVQFQQIKVGLRDAADQGDHDLSPAFLRGHEVGARGFVHPADAAPEVDFPDRFKAGKVAVHGLTAIRHRRGQIRVPSAGCFPFMVVPPLCFPRLALPSE